MIHINLSIQTHAIERPATLTLWFFSDHLRRLFRVLSSHSIKTGLTSVESHLRLLIKQNSLLLIWPYLFCSFFHTRQSLSWNEIMRPWSFRTLNGSGNKNHFLNENRACAKTINEKVRVMLSVWFLLLSNIIIKCWLIILNSAVKTHKTEN